MVEISSYIKVGDKFIDFEEFRGPFEDSFYVEGAIVIKVDDEPFISFKEWDLVDQLWGYLVQTLKSAMNGKTERMSFPDQPVDIEIEPIAQGKKLKLKLEYRDVKKHVVVDTAEFVPKFCQAASNFFKKAIVIDPAQAIGIQEIFDDLVEIGEIFARTR